MSRVISFSLWGDEPGFWRGALENAALAREFYPGWVCRFHVACDTKAPVNATGELIQLGAELRTCGASSWAGLFWRYAPIFDPAVEVTLVRDCDSRLNPREAAAVNAWLNQLDTWVSPEKGVARPLLLHHMRDHIEHTTVPIMGGACGFMHWPRMRELLGEWTDRDHKGADQEFLAARVWPELRTDSLCHDRYPEGVIWKEGEGDVTSYHYKPGPFFGEHERRPFPAHADYDTQKLGAFVGARIL